MITKNVDCVFFRLSTFILSLQKNVFTFSFVKIEIGGKNMAKKGQKFKTWTADEKYNVIKPIIDLEISLAQTGKNTGVSNSMLHRWIKSYKENGYDGLKAKKKPGNPLMKYSRRKNLTKEEHLEYENMKLRIENELLKKGYLMKGDGTIVKYTK